MLRIINIITLFLLFSFGFLHSQYNFTEKIKLAESYEKSGDYQNASRLWRELYDIRPERDDFFYGVIRTNKALNQFKDLIPFIENHLNIKKTSSLLALYGEILWLTGSFDEATKKWNQAIELFPNDNQTYIDVAAIQISLRLFERAINTYKIGREKLKNSTIFSDELSQLYTILNNYKDGTREILNYFEESRNQPITQGRINALINSTESKAYILEELRKRYKNSDDPEFRRLYAWYLRLINNHQEAFEQFKQIDRLVNAKGYEILNFANISLRDGEYSIALEAYAYLIDQGKSNTFFQNALFGYAKTLELSITKDEKLSKSKVLEIIDRYRRIISEFPNSQNSDEAYIRIANLFLYQLNEPEKAANELNTLLKVSGNRRITATASNLLGTIYLMQNKLEDAKLLFSNVRKKFEKLSPEEYYYALYKLAEIEYYSGNIDSAYSRYIEISNLSNTDVANDAIERILFIDQNRNFNKAFTLFSKAELLEFQKNYNLAIENYMSAYESAPMSNLAELSLIKIAQIYFSQSKFSDAIKTMELLLDKYKETIYGDLALITIANSYLAEGNYDNAIEKYTDLLSKYPRSIYLEEARNKIRNIRDRLN